MNHHIHSDFDSDADVDPYFEYNKCHTHSKLESKVANPQKFQKIEISRFFTRKRMEEEI
jgi:hypothetical protein